MSAPNESHATEHAHEHGPAHPARTYLLTLIALLILTTLTVKAAGIHFSSGAVNVVIALTIATIKASLVALFFMHLKYDKPVNAVILVAGFLFLGLLLMFTFTDVESRPDLEPTNLKPQAVPVMVAPRPAVVENH